MPREKHKRFFVYLLPAELERLDSHLQEISPGRENRSEFARLAIAEKVERDRRTKSKAQR